MGESSFSLLAILHGGFYVASGVWPLVHLRSFLRVTGPKRDLWLVRTVGILVAVIGGAVLMAGLRAAWSGETTWSWEVAFLAAGAALALACVDLVYVARKVIPPIYLLDAVAELLLVAAWGAVLVQRYA